MGNVQTWTQSERPPRTRYRPATLALGFALGLLVSSAACALITRASPAASLERPQPVAVADRDPFVPLVSQ
ncbi:MAG: hypothetical protein FJZ01_12475 [Candidatus Sericytochromatia bacterium]|nr:hypothetical protein [Candidatus Tanganyikabacteria bacterium]